jgi:hypothetical protein
MSLVNNVGLEKDDAATQAVDGVGEVVIARAAAAIEGEFECDEGDEDGDRQGDGASVRRFHPGAMVARRDG